MKAMNENEAGKKKKAAGDKEGVALQRGNNGTADKS